MYFLFYLSKNSKSLKKYITFSTDSNIITLLILTNSY